MTDLAKSSVINYTALGDVKKTTFMGVHIIKDEKHEAVEIYLRCYYKSQFEEMREKWGAVKEQGGQILEDFMDVMAKLVIAAEQEKKRFITNTKTPHVVITFSDAFASRIDFKFSLTPRELQLVSQFFYCLSILDNIYKNTETFTTGLEVIRASFKHPVRIFDTFDSINGIGYIV